MRLLAWIVYVGFGLPLPCFIWSWWTWTKRRSEAVSEWQRTSTLLLLALTSANLALAIALATYALPRRHLPPLHLVPPFPVQLSFIVGMVAAILSALLSALARRGMRIPILLCGIVTFCLFLGSSFFL
jgi:hypothetical protein